MLSFLYLLFVFILMGYDTPMFLAAGGRIVMFISISGVVAVLSEIIHRQKEVLTIRNRELRDLNNKLADSEKELRINFDKLVESERNLVASKERIQLILESSAEGIYGIDLEGTINFINSSAVNMLGYRSPLDLIGKNTHEFFHYGDSGDPPHPDSGCAICESLNKGATVSCDNGEFLKKDGRSFPVAFCIAPVLQNGEIAGAVVSFDDITERMKMLNQIESSLKEKEILLKEIHHRVKNNLQIVASLLNLQSRYIRDVTVLNAIKESQNRVRAMALVHERLYRSGELSTIDIGTYVQFLFTNLFAFYGVNPGKVTHTVTIEGIFFDINTAIPIGLIFNELISNSLKYAFPGDRRGTISVQGSVLPDGSKRITFQDNGIGIPEGFDWKNAESLGLRLVISLVDQLDGRIELKPGEGTIWEITIPEAKKNAE